MTQLGEKARALNFDIVHTEANGNCMFAAVAKQVGIPCEKRLRQQAIDYLNAHPEIGNFVDPSMTFAQYVDRMKRDGEWGDGPMLEVMVKMFQKPISILQSDGQMILLTSPNLLDTKPILLGYVAMGPGPRNHYVGLKEISNCELADTVRKQDELHTPGVDSKQEIVNQQQIRQSHIITCESDPLVSSQHDDSQPNNSAPKEVIDDQVRRPENTQSEHDSNSKATISLDIGDYIDKSQAPLSADLKLKLLTCCWEPPSTYDFRLDAPKRDHSSQRSFRRDWLRQYKWLSYTNSAKGAGAVCRYCVLFPQKVTRGIQGAFIEKPFTNYKKFHDSAKNHEKCAWHTASQEDAFNFIGSSTGKFVPVDQQISKQKAQLINDNRAKLHSIISCILFCSSHDIALRGKTGDSGNVHDLMDFRVEAGDTTMKNHLLTAAANAKYTSHRTQNDIIDICGMLVREDIVRDVNLSGAFSILGDETTDISGTEQLSIGVRFLGSKKGVMCIREEFLGFVSLTDRSAEGIAAVILNACSEFGLDMNKCVGQGYDGCSAMAGNEGGVQAIIRKTYPRAAFIHCSSHRLNLVVNDLNKVSEVRNVIGTIKSIIKFFRDSASRRRLIPNVPLLCETRWTHKYRSIRIFADNFIKITTELQNLSHSSVKNTRETAYQLLCAAQTPTFIVVLQLVKKYSSMLEPVTQALHAVQLDLLTVQSHVSELLAVIQTSRKQCDTEFKVILQQSEKIAEQLGTEIKAPRLATKQTNRNNSPSSSVEEYYRRAIYIPYLDSLISSLASRFSDENRDVFCLFELHPQRMSKVDKMQFTLRTSKIGELYEIDNFTEQACLWYDVWANRDHTEDWEMHFIELLGDVSISLFPAIAQAIRIALALPATTCTIERSFSTLRRVKTWLRSTMNDDRLSALCVTSVHRDMISGNECFIQRVIDRFAQNPRRIELLFK